MSRRPCAQNPQYFRQKIAATTSNELTGNQSSRRGSIGYYIMGSCRPRKASVLGGVRVEETETRGVGALQVLTPEERARRAAFDAARVHRLRIQGTMRKSAGATSSEFGRRQTARGEYRTVFPGVHFKFTPISRLVTRLSYATNIGRPAIGQLIPRTTANIENQTLSTSNPSLKPQLADNFDLATEYYFEPAGFISAGVFLKEIKDFIYTQGGDPRSRRRRQRFRRRIRRLHSDDAANGGYAKIKGIEISYSQQFTFLPGWWSGIRRVFANYTRMEVVGNYSTGGAINTGVSAANPLAPTSEVAGFNPETANVGSPTPESRLDPCAIQPLWALPQRV